VHLVMTTIVTKKVHRLQAFNLQIVTDLDLIPKILNLLFFFLLSKSKISLKNRKEHITKKRN
jgi:hypothetical protein